jgi:hypothetical protein
LRNSLQPLLSAEQITEVGVDPATRPEQLGLVDFAKLAIDYLEKALGLSRSVTYRSITRTMQGQQGLSSEYLDNEAGYAGDRGTLGTDGGSRKLVHQDRSTS